MAVWIPKTLGSGPWGQCSVFPGLARAVSVLWLGAAVPHSQQAGNEGGGDS